MTLNEVYLEIKAITQCAIQNGLSIQEKYPFKIGGKIGWEDQTDISIALRNVPYEDKYDTLNRERNFNFKMLDGALLQFMYEFNGPGRKLISHRLAFFPSPHLQRYDDKPEDYDAHFANSEFHDLTEKHIVAFPIRCDYNINEKFFKEIEHPYAHTHFGEYEYCRIPLVSPLAPSVFFNFIIRNFYNYAVRTKGEFMPSSFQRFSPSIVKGETQILHFHIS